MTRTDTGRASADQIALILSTSRDEDPENTAATDEILAHTCNTVGLPGECGPGGMSVYDDGSGYAAALIASLTPTETRER